MTAFTGQIDVAGWSADNAGCAWYRIKLPLDALAGRGRTTVYSRYLPRSRPRVLIGQRVSNPGPSRLWQEMAASDDRPRLIYELDDDLFHVDPDNAAAHAFFADPEIQRNIRANIEAADAVTVSTEPLAAVVREFHDHVHVVPNFLPDAVVRLGAELQHPRPGDPATVIGWAGSGTHNADFAECASYLRRFFDREPGTVFHTMGAWLPSMRPLLPLADRLRTTAWVADLPAFYEAVARSFDVGIAPLRPSVFNRSKSAIKVMEYAALGVPAVASDVGPYADYIEHGVTGLLVRRPYEWAVHLRDLVNDIELYRALAGAAHARATEMTIGRNIAQWERVIDGCSG
jgi:glycosyltransferase involved in cell wall biosynthesis